MAVERITPGSNAWIESYASHSERYNRFLPEFRNRSVLDAACGVGYGTHLIASGGAARIVGIDVSDEALQTAMENFSHDSAEFIKADCLNLPFESGSFDIVTSFETIEHVSSPKAFLKEIHRVLRPGGKLYLSCPNSLTHSLSHVRKVENPWHISEMNFEELTSTVERNFEIESLFHQTPSLSHLCTSHLTHLETCISRSLALKCENLVRRLLKKETIAPRVSNPSPSTLSHLTPYPILPLAKSDSPWRSVAHVFIVVARRKD